MTQQPFYRRISGKTVVIGIFGFIGLFITAVLVNAYLRPKDPWSVVRIEKAEGAGTGMMPMDTVVLANGTKTDTLGYNLALAGQITRPESAPIYIFKGWECHSCDALPVALVWSPTEGKRWQLPWPGPVYGFDYETMETSELISESHFWFGDCLPAQDGQEIVVMIHSRRDNTVLGTIINYDINGRPVENLVKHDHPGLDALVGRKGCHEIEGEKMMESP